MGAFRPHTTTVSLARVAPAELYPGSDLPLKIRVSSPSGWDLRGCRVRIATDEGTLVKEVELTSFDGTASETEEFVVVAPAELGDYCWEARFAAQEIAAVPYAESSASFSFRVRPHHTGVRVWGAPSPLTLDAPFKIKVGVQCSVGCDLAGQRIAVYDHEGVEVANCVVGEVPWNDADGQACAEVELKAPGEIGRYGWEIRLLEPDTSIPHEASTTSFTAGVAPHPDLLVTVEVVDAETKAPIEQANAILRPSIYRGSEFSNYTDAAGVAKVRVPKGEYHICAARAGYKSFLRIGEVARDMAVRAELRPGSDLDDIFG